MACSSFLTREQAFLLEGLTASMLALIRHWLHWCLHVVSTDNIPPLHKEQDANGYIALQALGSPACCFPLHVHGWRIALSVLLM
jgi:hypothetical protein